MSAGLDTQSASVQNLTYYVLSPRRGRMFGKHCDCPFPCPDGKASIAPRLVARGLRQTSKTLTLEKVLDGLEDNALQSG